MHEAGAYTQTMGGIAPLTWQELQAYINLTGEVGLEWENKIIMLLSKEYVEGYNIGLDPLAAPPFGNENPGPIVSPGFFAKLEAERKK